MWQKHPRVPNVQYASNLAGGYVVMLKREGQELKRAIVPNARALEMLVAEWSTSDKHVPLGDIIAKITNQLGIEKCEPCAKRQQVLNRLLRRF